MRTIFLLLLTFSLATQSAIADGILLAWSSRDVTGVTEQAFNEAKQLSVDEILKKNLKVASWPDAYLLTVSANAKKEDKELIKGLVSQITDKSKAKLKYTNKLIIWERIKTGEILFEGRGFQVSDDLFTVTGRANYMLRNMTRKNFGHVRPNSTPEELTALQQKWSSWTNNEKVSEFQNPYVTSVKGLEEIRSLEALEALIFSLKPSSVKNKLTKACLKSLYNTDKLPTDPNSPATLCSPERYTYGYLRVLTGVKDMHDHAWWKKWWETNMNSLKWNPELGQFEIRSQVYQ